MTEAPENAPGPDLVDAAKGHDPTTIELRRAIHQDPELGLQLPRTQQRILESLTGLGLDISTGDTSTSVVADLDTGKPGPTILLRGDMDALPLQEDYPSEFKSAIDGAMHACGHDSHVAMLAGAARLLSENTSEFNGKIRFMFQPGEEGFHGAKHMIDEGVLAGVDRAFAIHIISNMPDGVFFSKGGSLMASADEFTITISGSGGHASMPHQALDPIPAAAATITGLHTMVGREVDAARSGVVTVAHVQAGTTSNIIPPSAFLEGTIRTLDEDTRSTIHASVERVATNTAAAHGCGCSCEIVPGYPVTVNNPAASALSNAVADELFGPGSFVEMPNAIMGAEDWSYVLNQVPGSMAFMGACPSDLSPGEAAPNHSNLMRLNENSFHRGVAMYAAMAMVR